MTDTSKPHNIIIGQKVQASKIELSRQMRKVMTLEERALWTRLKGSALGKNFRRQQIIDGFIVDFYCHAAALVVEVDGPIHRAEYDAERDAILAARGLRILRFRNEDVIKRMGWVVSEIVKHI